MPRPHVDFGHDRPRTESQAEPEAVDIAAAFAKLAANPSLKNVAPMMAQIQAEAAKIHRLEPDGDRPWRTKNQKTSGPVGIADASEAAAERASAQARVAMQS
jgi:hypothetical protein